MRSVCSLVVVLLADAAHASDMPAAKHLGLPAVPEASGNGDDSAKTKLGRMLFFDVSLSGDQATACASCHRPELAFTDGRPVAIGVHGKKGSRNTPSLLNAALNQYQFWDGRRSSLEDQALDPMRNASELGIDHQELLSRLRSKPAYVAQFNHAFPGQASAISLTNVAAAIAAFERSLLAGDSDFDRYYFGGDKTALSTSAKRGLKVFTGPGGCSGCHVISATEALFTDGHFHRVPMYDSRITAQLGELATQAVVARRQGSTVDGLLAQGEHFAALGRFAVTLNVADIAHFRTPSLRNVALTAPYMHDGSIPTLREAVIREAYGQSGAAKDVRRLTPAEIDDLVQLLASFTSPSVTDWPAINEVPSIASTASSASVQ